MKYRPEIDGLRALAVIPVILFHAGFKSFSGGYIGVDVFFVISGYLITTILIEDLENNRFSLIKFYERRARRILPALYFVMLVCIPFCWLWMTPTQWKVFSQSLGAVTLFVSNILFWREFVCRRAILCFISNFFIFFLAFW
jgi:peptidoglycan/LPS O-acetylase OafA/YrhL